MAVLFRSNYQENKMAAWQIAKHIYGVTKRLPQENYKAFTEEDISGSYWNLVQLRQDSDKI